MHIASDVSPISRHVCWSEVADGATYHLEDLRALLAALRAKAHVVVEDSCDILVTTGSGALRASDRPMSA
jgi:hypothetical protein